MQKKQLLSLSAKLVNDKLISRVHHLDTTLEGGANLLLMRWVSLFMEMYLEHCHTKHQLWSKKTKSIERLGENWNPTKNPKNPRFVGLANPYIGLMCWQYHRMITNCILTIGASTSMMIPAIHNVYQLITATLNLQNY